MGEIILGWEGMEAGVRLLLSPEMRILGRLGHHRTRAEIEGVSSWNAVSGARPK